MFDTPLDPTLDPNPNVGYFAWAFFYYLRKDLKRKIRKEKLKNKKSSAEDVISNAMLKTTNKLLVHSLQK